VILGSARAAFTSGVDVVAGVSTVIVVALAVVSAVRVRRVIPSSEVAEAETVAVDPGPSLGSPSGKGIPQ
jgi:hypothetical protein